MDLSLSALADLSTWGYLVIFLICVGDAIFPVLPSEAAVIFGAILATRGELSFVGLVGSAALGAVVGDNVSYAIGSVANRKGKDPEDLSGRFGDALAWAEAALDTKGAQMIMVARFIPGGRTAITFGAGYLSYSRSRFLTSTALAGSVWAIYATLLGYLGGRVFKDQWWAALLLGVGVSLVVAGLIQLIRKLTGNEGPSVADKRKELRRERRKRRRSPKETDAAEDQDRDQAGA